MVNIFSFVNPLKIFLKVVIVSNFSSGNYLNNYLYILYAYKNIEINKTITRIRIVNGDVRN